MRNYRAKPEEVTADRLARFLDRHGDKLSGRDHDDIGRVIFILESIADGTWDES